jgi:hypothetical protein
MGTAFAIAAFSAFVDIAQIALGGEPLASSMMAGAVLFGLLSVQAAGVLTALGILNLVLVGRLLLGALIIKNVAQGDPITARLLEPEDTSAVMLLGFAGVWLATVLVRNYVHRLRIFDATSSLEGLRALTIVLLVGGTIALVAVRVSSGNDESTVGGAWGVAKEFISFRTACLPALMLYLWRTKRRRWLTHPAVLAVLLFLSLQGLLGSSKQGMAEPFALYIMMAWARYGWRHPVLWLGLPLAFVSFQYFISPIGQFARNEGGRDKNPREAATATFDIVIGYLSDPQYRERILHADDALVDKSQLQATYIEGKLNSLNRIAMVGEADRLVSATNRYGNSGFETIGNSLLFAVPHVLYPQKPQSASGNFLGRYAGDLGDEDYGTQVSYGFMANAYNAYGILWVLPLSFLCAFLVLGFVSLSSAGPFFEDPWSLLAIAAMHQAYVESSFTGEIGAFHQPIDALILLSMTLVLARVLRSSGLAAQRAATAPLSTT